MKVNKKQQVIIGVAVGAILVFLAGRYLITSLHADLTEQNRQIKLAESQLRKGLKVQKNKKEISTDYKKYGPYLRVAGTNERRIIAEMLEEVERLVRSVGGNIINLTPQDAPDERESFKEYKVNFRIEAKFSQLLKFFSEVQENKRLIKFDKLTVTSKTDGLGALMVEGTISSAVSF